MANSGVKDAWGNPLPGTPDVALGTLIVGTGPGALGTVGVGSDTQVLTADHTQAGGVKWAPPAVNSTFPGSIITAPLDSHSATTGFGQVALGTPIRNTLGSDILVTVSIPVTASTGGSIKAGVASTATPTTDPVTPALSAAAVITVTQYVPNGYYLSLALSGTITAGTPVTQVNVV